ncbi:SNF2 family N-terminal domain-containing protein [Ephemerocybe angulata]|uniref:SNF2 family N-terminal domain-containing protein n=1 Tax=Ephemerocybe angulata TaxID=980116 RepID=A0A8H6M322_9AGAR|nr:SNF2 family N-terminal domain-containing protein [Tulosesus angulatus]
MDEYPRDLFGDPGDDAAAKVAKELLEKVGMDVPAPMRDGRDDDGLFYGRGRDIYAGPQARAGDINQFLIMAGNAEQFDSSASVAKGLEKLGLKALVDLIPGMEVSLMPHQVIGVSWMIDKEAGPTKGGCLADDMGLGKTVQLIALMVMNKAPETVRHKLNLIIAPLALLDQWKYEIETKTSCGLKVLIYHGQNRPRKKSALREYDVILTTYNTMAMEWPDYEKQEKLKAKARKQKRRDDSFIVEDSDGELYEDKVRGRKEKSGLLFQMEFFRIILDEGQNVRNRTTRGSRAVSELTATYRWCLTGTPIMNSLTDTYGYIRFLKIRPWYDWSEFNAHIALKEKKNPSLAVTRLQAILATFQLRRTKQSMLDGKRLIEIPEKTIEITALEFTAEELEIYKMVEARTQATFNRYLRAGTVLKNYHQVLVLLLRLRQVCSHPCLILEEVGAFVPFEEVDHSKPELASELTRAAKLINPEFVVDMKARMKERMIARMEAEKRSADAALEGEECPICFDVMTKTAVVTACKHAFCKECIMDVINNPAVDDEVVRRKDERPCPVCRASISESHLFTRSAFEPTEKELNPNARESEDEGEAINSDDSMDVDDDDEEPVSRKGKGRAVKRGRGAYRGMEEDDDEDDDDDMSDFIVEDDEDEEDKDARRALKQRRNKGKGKRRANVIIDSDEEVEDAPEIEGVLLGRKSKAQLEKEALEKMPRFLPSTKMKFMMELIKKIFKANPEEKILIVSQWTACLSLVSDYLTEKGIGHVKYQGDMNRDKRDIAVRVFMSKEKAKIMLMSLKCGGVGLNLTRANNVISLDLAWSRAVESQAWDRLHRLGQTRTVNVQRLVIAGTVEDRIMALQDRKQSLADGSLGEGKGKKLGKLTVAQLGMWFLLPCFLMHLLMNLSS